MSSGSPPGREEEAQSGALTTLTSTFAPPLAAAPIIVSYGAGL